jgi:general secretion pathway protein J
MRSSARGFSIIEIVIAAALLAALGLLLFTLLKTSIRSRNTLESVSTRHHAGRLAIERMTNELSMAYLSTHKNPSNVVVQTDFRGEEHRIAFDAFGNIPFVKGAKESDQREISYFIDDDKRTNKPALMRKVHNSITSALGKEGHVEVLCPDVKDLSLKYWDSEKTAWQSTWTTDGSDSRQTLPTRILIELTIAMSEREEKFVSEVEIWLD